MERTTGWELAESDAASGGNYLFYNGPNSFPKVTAHRIKATFKVEKAGRYSVKWNMRQPDDVAGDQANDAWICFKDATQLARQTTITGFHKFVGRSKGTFGLWDPQVFEDYCRYGVLPVVDESGADDGVRLACPALVEASVYLGSSETDVHQLIPNIRIPVTVLRAPPREPGSVELDFSKSPTVPDLASRFVQAQDVLLAELTHFIPMQAPKLVADYIKRAL